MLLLTSNNIATCILGVPGAGTLDSGCFGGVSLNKPAKAMMDNSKGSAANRYFFILVVSSGMPRRMLLHKWKYTNNFYLTSVTFRQLVIVLTVHKKIACVE